MEPSRSSCACLCVGLVLLFHTKVRSEANNLAITMAPEFSEQISNRSQYHSKVDFIKDFLLNNAENNTTYSSDFTMPPSNNTLESNETRPLQKNIENVETSSSLDNNTTTNELQVIPKNSVPAAFSSVIDTLPVHPRIPRRSVAKRKTRVRLNRHSTRVNTDLPVRFLLPPPIAKPKCSDHGAGNDTPFKIKPIVISSSTPLIPISAIATPNEYVVAAKPLKLNSEQKTLSSIKVPPNRRVFVPPPPRHLLPPPFSQESHYNNHFTTPKNSIPERNSVSPVSPQNNVYESSTKPHDCDKTNRIESASVKPIVVVEDIREINNWNSQSSHLPSVHSSPYHEPVRNVELINNNEPIKNLETFGNFPPADYPNQFVASTTSEKPPLYGKPNIPNQEYNNEYETHSCDKNHSTADSHPQYSDSFSPNKPQQLNHDNQPISENDQILFPNNQDRFQNNEKPIVPNIPQKYRPFSQHQTPNSQLQSRPSNQIYPNNQHYFHQDYQTLLPVDNQQTFPTHNPQDFKLNSAQPLSNHDLTQNKPLCNESNQLQSTPGTQYNQQDLNLSDQYNQHQLSLDKQSNQQQYPSDKLYNQQQFPSDKQYSQQELSPNIQYNQQQIHLDQQYNQQLPADKQFNQQQYSPDKQYSQQQLLHPNNQQYPSDKEYNQHQFPSHEHHSQHELHPVQQQFPSDKQSYNQQQLKPDSQQHYASNHQYHQQAVRLNDQQNVSPSDEVQFSQSSATQTSVTRELSPFSAFKSSPFEDYSLKPTTPLPLSSSIQPYPFLRGPNIEQTLFDTGNFQVDDTYFNNTDDSTMAMMNRPLLTQEVARMGMKITANLKMEQIKKAKLSRGKYKYNHFNQFNFPEVDDTARSNEVSKSSKLLVAETSYYKDRKGVQELTETADLSVIPGTPGVDYPILNRPPLRSDFSCRSVQNHRGYVADPSTRCQVFYICVGSGPGEAMLCPNGTLFSQDFLVCDWWFNIDCQPYS